MNTCKRIDKPTTDSVLNPPDASAPNVPVITGDNRFCGFQITKGNHNDTVFLLSPDENNGSWGLPITDESSLKEAWEHRDCVDTHVPLEERIHALSDAKGYSVPDITLDKNDCQCGCDGSEKTVDEHEFNPRDLYNNDSDNDSDDSGSEEEDLDWEDNTVCRGINRINPLEL